jgi:hypothetical protein
MLITFFIGILLLYFIHSETVFIPFWIKLIYSFVLATNIIIFLIRVKSALRLYITNSINSSSSSSSNEIK